MAAIYILRAIYTPVVKGRSFNIHWQNHGYYSSREKAEEQIRDFAELTAEEEEEGLDADSISVGYLVEQQEIDRHPSSNELANTWLYDHKGNLVDTETLPQYVGKAFRGRPQSNIRFQPGDIVGVMEIDSPRVKLGVVIETPPTPESFADYAQRHPFLYMVGEDDCYNVAFSEQRTSMEHPTHLLRFRTGIPTDLERSFAEVYSNLTRNKINS